MKELNQEKTLTSNFWDDDKCLRCGKCCYYNGIPCRYLRFNKDGTTYCKIYKRRLGAETGTAPGHVCTTRKNSPYDYEGCPYNTGKPIK